MLWQSVKFLLHIVVVPNVFSPYRPIFISSLRHTRSYYSELNLHTECLLHILSFCIQHSNNTVNNHHLKHWITLGRMTLFKEISLFRVLILIVIFDNTSSSTDTLAALIPAPCNSFHLQYFWNFTYGPWRHLKNLNATFLQLHWQSLCSESANNLM